VQIFHCIVLYCIVRSPMTSWKEPSGKRYTYAFLKFEAVEKSSKNLFFVKFFFI